jgi:hypothetical protein
MGDKQCDVSPAEKRSVEAYAKRRAALREEYIKQITNPHRHGTGEGGTLVRKICYFVLICYGAQVMVLQCVLCFFLSSRSTGIFHGTCF